MALAVGDRVLATPACPRPHLPCGLETGFMFVVVRVVFITVLESGDYCPHSAEGTEVPSGPQAPRAWRACEVHACSSFHPHQGPSAELRVPGPSHLGCLHRGLEPVGAGVTELKMGWEQVFLPQLWWVLGGTGRPWTRRALWFEDSDVDGIRGQWPVLGWQLGSHVTRPGKPDLAPTPPAVGIV